MKEIKGFQQPNPKGNDMLRSEEGPWKIYQRGPSYRVGMKSWWGIKWLTTCGAKGGFFAFQTNTLTHAQAKLVQVNEEAYDKKWYKDNKWEVKK